MRLSKYFLPILKENPKDAEIVSHRLMARAGNPDVIKAELAALVSDRSDLAEQLDASLAREKQLQLLADEASEALGSAIEEVRAAIGREGQPDG